MSGETERSEDLGVSVLMKRQSFTRLPLSYGILQTW